MDGKDDIIVGAITNYDWPAIAPWVNSLDQCGFEGKKVLICYNIKKEVIEKLTGKGYTILAFKQDADGNYIYKQDFSIVVERFFHLWALLNSLKGKHRYLLHTDVKDVIFQRNPSDYFNFMDASIKIIAASESITYERENWGRENLKSSFGEIIYEEMKWKTILNAGTLSGEFDTMLDFFLNVYMVSAGGRTHNPDQAAVNILLRSEVYKEITHIARPSEDAWACQAGTTHDPNKIKEYSPFIEDKRDLLSRISSLDDGEYISNVNGVPLYLVHQYDRVPGWKEFVLKKYGD
jgi:hypothetical protein